jgi:predicted nucleotidyltransferase
MVKDIVDFVLNPLGLSVEKMYLVGSYASGRANEYSDIDYLVIMKGGKREYTYPEWKQIQEINQRIDNKRIHCIYGTNIEVQESLRKKNPVKFAYREIENVNTHTSSTQS